MVSSNNKVMLKVKDEYKRVVKLAKNDRREKEVNYFIGWDFDNEKLVIFELTAMYEKAEFIKFKFTDDEIDEFVNEQEKVIDINKLCDRISI